MDDSRVRYLARILVDEPGERECAACLDGLEAYVAAQLAGENYAERFPAVAGHLDACVVCAELYGQLYELMADPANAPAPAAIPAPDLSFLPRRVDPAAALSAAVERLADGLRLNLSGLLLDLFRPDLRAAPALRDAGPPPIFDLAVERPDGPITRVHVRALSAAGAPGRCAMRVQVELAGREWPELAGVAVTLSLSGERYELRTDAWGEAVFDDLPQDELAGGRLEVRG